MKFTGEYLRELADKRDKLVNEARGFYETMNESEAGSDAASQAKESYKKLRVDLDQADSEFREATAWVAEQQELRDLEARNREFQSAIDKGISLAMGENRGAPEIDPAAPIPTATGSADPAEDVSFRDAYFRKLRDFAQRCAAENGIEISNPTPYTNEHRNIVQSYERRSLSRADAKGTADKGINTIPETFSGELIEFMKFSGPMVPGGMLCREFNTDTGADYHLTTVNDTGNDAAAPVTEAKRADVSKTATFAVGKDPLFNRITFGAHLYDSKIIPITYEMLMDTQIDGLEMLLGELGGKRLGRKINTDFTGELMTAVKQKVTTAANTGYVPDDIIKLPHKIDPSYRGVGRSGSTQNRLQIMFNDDTYQSVRLLKQPYVGDTTKAPVETPYLTENGRDIMDGDADKLLGRYPIWLNQNMDDVAAGKDVMVLGDFAHARIRSVAMPFVKWSEEYYWDRQMLAMIALQRCDFKVTLADCFAKLTIKT